MMSFKIKPIRNENDYNASLEYLNQIFDAKEGSQEWDDKELLSILIESYEEDNFKIDKPDPVDAIKFRMEQENLTQKDLVPIIGSRSRVSEVLSGKRTLTLKMIRALNKHLGIPAEILLQEKKQADLSEFEGVDFEKFPLNEMKKYGVLNGFDSNNIKDKAEKAIRFLIDRTGGTDCLPEGLFRKSHSPRINANVDHYALNGWCLSVLSKVKDQKIDVHYNSKKIKIRPFINNLVSLSVLNNGPLVAKEYLAKHGIILTILPHFKNTYLDGASFIINDGTPVVALTLRHDRIDNFWFTLLHEIAHIKMHLSTGGCIIDDMSLRNSKHDPDSEKEADLFAEKALLPAQFDLHLKNIISKEDVIEYAYNNNIHPAIVAGRIQHYKNNYRLFSNLVGRGEVRRCFNLQ